MHAILKYFPDLSENQIRQFSMLENLYREWNGKINLISRKDIDSLYLKHVLHSLAIAKFIKFKAGTSILDVGTGGGFPGIPLSIMFPEIQFTLNDSIAKKIRAVEEIASSAGLKNVTVFHGRAEEVKDKYDFIVSRAVTNFPQFYNWVKGKINSRNMNSSPNGILYLKGGELGEELMNFKNRIKVFEISEYFKEDFFETKKLVYYS